MYQEALCLLYYKTSLPKLPIKGSSAKLRIRGFNCPPNTDPSLYLFEGLDKSHYADGKGKLKLISKTEWLTSPDIEKTSLFDGNICYEMYENYELKNSGVKEIIGTFKNGSLEFIKTVFEINLQQTFYMKLGN